mmetsp:Transcript_25238/g.49153  ORF Transcript_25238/g.49153 Transcript_25238/m.49153 type:complete len:198 (-) Transcript_25238:664-1257(-)
MNAQVVDLTLDDSPPRAGRHQAPSPEHREQKKQRQQLEQYIELDSSDDPGSEDSQHDSNEGPMHHPGVLEVNYDNWPDHDERCHGVIDSNALRREYPENYVWSCCNSDGDTEGCTKGEGPSIDEKYATSEGPSEDEDAEMWHPGELEVEYDDPTWDDWDEDCHGQIDTKTHRREYPEGFRWSCCNDDGTAEGCTPRR